MSKLASYLGFFGLIALVFLGGFVLSLSAESDPQTLAWTSMLTPYDPVIVPAAVTGAPGSGFLFAASNFTPNTTVDIFFDNSPSPRPAGDAISASNQASTLIGTAVADANGEIAIALQTPAWFANTTFQLTATNGAETVTADVTLDSSASLQTLPSSYTGPRYTASSTPTPVPSTNTPAPTASNTPFPQATSTPISSSTFTPVPSTNTPAPTVSNTPFPQPTTSPQIFLPLIAR